MIRLRMIMAMLVLAPLALVAARLDVLDVRAPSMNTTLKCSVLLPDAYDKSGGEISVVYLLHGCNGTHMTLVSPVTSNAVDRYGFAIVCPWGGHSWWMDAPQTNSCFETWLVKDLLPLVETRYRMRKDRAGRGIAGTSMGGFGAHYIGIRHKDLFSAVGSIFGAFDLTKAPDKWGKPELFGRSADGDGGRAERSILKVSESLNNGELMLIEIVGTSDFTLAENRALHESLTKRGIAHSYVEIRGSDDVSSKHTYKFAWPAFDMIFHAFDSHFNGNLKSRRRPDEQSRK